MNIFLTNSVYFGVILSLISYGLGVLLRKKTGLVLMNPLLISIVLTIAALLVLNVDYNAYNTGARYISYLLTPATICLAVPLYEKLDLLKKNFKAIFLGILSGVLTSLIVVLLLSVLLQLNHSDYVTLLPKSITTAIGIGVSEELGGNVSLTAAVIIVTGILGNILAETICKIFRITDPIAKGVGIGSASHAIGTSKAMEIGEIEGAMSSLSIVVAGILTVIGSAVFAGLH